MPRDDCRVAWFPILSGSSSSKKAHESSGRPSNSLFAQVCNNLVITVVKYGE